MWGWTCRLSLIINIYKQILNFTLYIKNKDDESLILSNQIASPLLQLALDSADDSLHGNCDRHFTQHSYCTNEYNLHAGQASGSSWIRCGSYITSHSNGEMFSTGM